MSNDSKNALIDIITREVGDGILGHNESIDYGFRLLKWRRELRKSCWCWGRTSTSWLADMSLGELVGILHEVRFIKQENNRVQAEAQAMQKIT